MTISSYSLVLMVIHFLQYGVSPPVLPCLHAMYPDKFVVNELWWSNWRMFFRNILGFILANVRYQHDRSHGDDRPVQ